MIIDGETITSADLDAAFGDGYISALQTSAERLPDVHLMQWGFVDVLSGTDEELRQVVFVPNDNFEVIEFGCSSYSSTSDGTITATLTGPTLGDVQLTGTHSAAYLDLPRYHNTSGLPDQVLLKGATYIWTVATDQSSGTTNITPQILVRTRVRRAV